MRRRRVDEYGQPSPFYPPPDVLTPQALTYVEQRRRFIETPLDDNGLIKMPELLQAVQETTVLGYAWKCMVNGRKIKSNVHHAYYTDETSKDYPKLADATVNPHEFREAGTNKVRLPIQFHNHLHDIVIPAPPPPLEIMREYIEAQRNANRLFCVSRESKRLLLQREVGLDDQMVRQALIENFEGFLSELEQTKSIPKEFRIVDLGDFQPRCITDITMISGYLGRISTMTTVTRDLQVAA